MHRLHTLVAGGASIAMHALLVALSLIAIDRTAAEERAEFRDTWATESVEVGVEAGNQESIPARASDAPAPAPPAAPEPPARPATEHDALEPAPAAEPRAPGPDAPKPAAPKPAAPKPTASAPASTAPAGDTPGSSADNAAPAAASAAGTLGAIGLPAGTRYLAAAFARAVPEASHRDPAWLEAPLGPAGSALVEIEVDESGQIARVELDPERATPAIVEQMVDRAVRMLKVGTFSLEPNRVSVGVERLELEVRVAMRAPNPDETANPRHLFEEGREAPTRERPGRAYFTLNSGRHVDVSIRLAGAGSPGRGAP